VRCGQLKKGRLKPPSLLGNAKKRQKVTGRGGSTGRPYPISRHRLPRLSQPQQSASASTQSRPRARAAAGQNDRIRRLIGNRRLRSTLRVGQRLSSEYPAIGPELICDRLGLGSVERGARRRRRTPLHPESGFVRRDHASASASCNAGRATFRPRRKAMSRAVRSCWSAASSRPPRP
jgi:hypothetical protein